MRCLVLLYGVAVWLIVIGAEWRALAMTPATARLSHVRTLFRASSVIGLRSEIKSQHSWERERRLCGEQLSATGLPTACFSVLKFEGDRHLVSAMSKIHDLNWLEQVCIRRAAKVDRLDVLLSALNEFLPKKCEAAVRSRLADIRYQYGEDEPDRLFRERYRAMERVDGN